MKKLKVRNPVGDKNNDTLNSSDKEGLNTKVIFKHQYERMITRHFGGFISDCVNINRITQ